MCGFGSMVCAPALGHGYIVYKTSIAATGEHGIFTAGEAIISCKKIEFKFVGELGPEAAVALTPVYKECQVAGNVAVVKTEKKAQLELETPFDEIKVGEFDLSTALIGESGADISITATISGEKCEITIPRQAFSGETTRFQNTGPESGAVHMKMEGIHFTSNGKCTGLVAKEGNDLEYEGTAAEKGLIAE